ncbi:M48 family metalloprotease [Adhaeribacter aquaticus]|uniref:M48 family metalloprotease n=1 Tax=Adhaeribacter aquaticus TaxID=299567 RepID=UPI000415F68E|nr:M48 family metalloprotease [Adhaeribacter aquaticus]
MGSALNYIIALLIAGFSLISYWCKREENTVTGEVQHIDMTVDQEIALGLQAAPQMAQQYGGLHRDDQATAKVKNIGQRLVQQTKAGSSPYRFDFHLLADEKTLNAFALPGGQIFITAGLLRKLSTEGQLAGILGHEIGHVIARHSAEQLAKAKLTQGLAGAAGIATYDPDRPASASGAIAAAAIAKLLTLKYGREDELESDLWAVKFTAEAGYDPRGMIEVMKILGAARNGASSPEFFQTHPNPENRIARLETAIQEEFPQGVPSGLIQ